MKKRNFKSLQLKKESISSLEKRDHIKGGGITGHTCTLCSIIVSCYDYCPSDNCVDMTK